MAKVKTDTARIWVYVCDDRPFAAADPPAALFQYSRDRRREHPRAHLSSWLRILQADAYVGYGELYAPARMPPSLLETGCFAHARRKFFETADVASAARKKSRGNHARMINPIALEFMQREGERDCPLEDCGGIPGSYEMLEAREDPDHPDHAEITEWLDEYDPEDLDVFSIQVALGRIAACLNAAAKRIIKPPITDSGCRGLCRTNILSVQALGEY